MRQRYLDNIRCGTVLLVVLYHLVYQYNSVGVISNLDVQGIPQLDALLCYVYPWFMGLLFVVAGMSARYSLDKRGTRGFLHERVKKVLIPSVAGIFLLGWINGWVTNQYSDIFQGASVPALLRYVIYCFCGIGPLWFLHELFLGCLLLLLIRRLDRTKRLDALFSRLPLWTTIVLFVPVALSSGFLVTPVVEAYRNGFYLLLFLLGYYWFVQERVTDSLARAAIWLAPLTALFGIWYTVHWFGQNYTTQQCLNSLPTNAYAWLGILSVLGAGKRWCNRETILTRRIQKHSFAIFVLHNPFLVLTGYLVCEYTALPMAGVYPVNALLEIVCLTAAIWIIRRIPPLKRLLLGE
ncbi:MAG: acyltransferase family protein [Butyricicoccus sp.]